MASSLQIRCRAWWLPRTTQRQVSVSAEQERPCRPSASRFLRLAAPDLEGSAKGEWRDCDLSASLAGEGSFSFCQRKLTDVIGSAIVFLPSQREIYADLPRAKSNAPHLGLAGEIEVEGLSEKPTPGSVRPSPRPRECVSLSNVTVPPTVHLESSLPLLPAFSNARCHCL